MVVAEAVVAVVAIVVAAGTATVTAVAAMATATANDSDGRGDDGGWLPPEGAHRPQGTYPTVWRGEYHGHSLSQCYTRMMMQWRGISYGQ